MSEIDPKQVADSFHSAGTIFSVIGGFFAGIATIFFRVLGAVRRVEKAEESISYLKKSDAEQGAKIDALEKILPRLMDEPGVIKVFQQQVAVLNQMHDSLKREIDIHNSNIRNEVSEVKNDLRQVNENLLKLIQRDPRSRQGDI